MDCLFSLPVDDKGRYNADFPQMQGQFVFKCNEPVIELLTESGHLVARTTSSTVIRIVGAAIIR